MNQLYKVANSIKPVRLRVITTKLMSRTLLSNAYCCSEMWHTQRASLLPDKVNLDDLYHELDQRFQKTGAISAVDVDIYANKVEDAVHTEELLDLVHKLRMSSQTTKMHNSTSHAIIRYLLEHNKKSDLLNVLDDRLNYGVFVESFIANVLMDKFYQQKDYVAGCKVAAELVLQEEVMHPISKVLALLHCYNYLCNSLEWPEAKVPQEPEEEIKVRVKFLRNPYDDEHFDLRDGMKIIGKILCEFTLPSYQMDDLDRSFHIIGLFLSEKWQKCNSSVNRENLFVEVLNLLPEKYNLKKLIESTKTQSGDIQMLLEKRLFEAEEHIAKEDIANQYKLYNQWDIDRKIALEQQVQKANIGLRIETINKIKEELKIKEEKLWFFENQENIELAIQKKKVYYPRRWFGKKKNPRKVDEGYVPPEL